MADAVVFLSLIVLAIASEAANPNYLYHECSNTTTFTPNSTYQSNLNLLFSSLVSNSSNNNGFHNTTAGQTPNTVYGLFLCRGDISTDNCRDCVTFATEDVVGRCPVDKASVIWFDECLLRYSHRTFFNSVNEASIYIFANDTNQSSFSVTNQSNFSDVVRSTMNDLATQASSSDKKFATGVKNFSLFNTLYTLAQCTQDLSSRNCQRCLQVAVGNLQIGKIGARTLGPSCNVRYETYLFYNKSAVPVSPPSPLSLPPSVSSKGKF